MLRILSMASSLVPDEQLGGVVEIVSVGNDDGITGRQAAQHLDVRDRGGTQLDGCAYRPVTADDIKGVGRFVNAGAALELHYRVALVEHDAHRGALVLAQAGLLHGVEFEAASDLV